MIEHATGDMWERYGETGTIMVLAANCAGVMGAGQVKPYPKRDPSGFAAYKKLCSIQPLGSPVTMGRVTLIGGDRGNALIFPTMAKPGWPAQERWIIEGCRHWVRLLTEPEPVKPWTWLVPMLGCGIGRLNPARVTAILVEHLSPIEDHTFVLYGPKDGAA